MSREKKDPVTIVVDTREQRPLDFSPFVPEIAWQRGTLATGDYSVEGLEHAVAIERKSVEDLVATLNNDFEPDTRRPPKRFNRELSRMARLYPIRALVVDGHRDDFTGGIEDRPYRSMTAPLSVLGRLAHIVVAYGVPVIFAAPLPRRLHCRAGEPHERAWTRADNEARKSSAAIVARLAIQAAKVYAKWNRSAEAGTDGGRQNGAEASSEPPARARASSGGESTALPLEPPNGRFRGFGGKRGNADEIV